MDSRMTIVYFLWKDTKVVYEASTIHTSNSDHMVKMHVKKMEVTVKWSCCQFPTVFMITTNKWVELTSLINVYNTTKQDSKPTSIGRPCFITVLMLQQQMLTSFTDYQFLYHMEELLKAGSTARLMSRPGGRPFQCDARAQHRLTYGPTKYCVLCKSK